MKYVALLRGIGPGNPNMKNDKLRGVFERLGFENVRSVISSGNILFDTPETNIQALEDDIQSALQLDLGINGGTVIRDEAAIKDFVATKPFKKAEHSPSTYLTVTFFKGKYIPTVDLPHKSDRGYEILSYDKKINAICSVTDISYGKTPDLMTWLEKQYSKDITTRTMKTVERIASKF